MWGKGLVSFGGEGLGVKTAVVIGRGKRERALCQVLAARGFAVFTHPPEAGAGERGLEPMRWPEGAWIWAPLADIGADGVVAASGPPVALTPEDFDRIGPDGVVVAGRVDPVVRGWAASSGVRVVALRESEAFNWLNAVPTAEGAIRAAMGLDGRSLASRQVAVMGFGRVGTVLALRLKGYGCATRVLDARPLARIQARALGLDAAGLIPAALHGVEVVFNTIPVPVVAPDWLAALGGAWFLELASPPGAVPPVLRPALRYRPLPNLPAEVAAEEAAQIVWDSTQLALFEAIREPASR